MEISRSNYEEFFIDYIDGRLPKSQLAAFNAFLLANPDLAEELEGFSSMALPHEELSLGDKSFLKKTPSPFEQKDFFEESCIAFLEGDLDQDQVLLLNAFLDEHPKQKHEFELFQKTRLHADPSVVFLGKDRLRKTALSVVSRKRIIAYSVSVGTIAASFLLFFYFYLGRQEHTEALLTFEPQVVRQQSLPEKKQAQGQDSRHRDVLAYVETSNDGNGSPATKSTQTTSKSTPNRGNKSKTPAGNIEKPKTEMVLPQNNSKMGVMHQLNGIQMVEIKKRDDLSYKLQFEKKQAPDSTGRLVAFFKKAKDRLLPEGLKERREIGISDIAHSINRVASEYIKLEHTIDQSTKTEIYAINIVGYEFTRTRTLK